MYQNKAAWLALLPTAMENASCKVDKLLCDVWFPPEVVLGWRVGLLLLQLFPNGGATDVVFVIPFCIAVGTAIAVVRWSLRNAGRTLP